MIKPRVAAAAALLALASATTALAMPPDFIKLSAVASDIKQDMRYAGADNFTGAAAPGYDHPVCWLKLKAAIAMSRVAGAAAEQGLRPIVWDCYRPKQATAAFLRWAADATNVAAKDIYFPRVAKSRLFADGYISRKSTHSTGYAIDLGLLGKDGAPLDFGGGFDLFDSRSATASAEVSAEARANRAKLVALMAGRGFVNNPREWWHFSLPHGADVLYDAPIER